jgi:amino acid transporter
VGIFYLPADLAQGAPGLWSVAALAATGLALVPVALVFAILGRRFDEDGGPVVYARAAFGELAAFLVGWVAYVSAVASTSAVVSGLASALAPSASASALRLLAAGLAVAIALFCTRGIRPSAQAWTTLTILKLLPLVALVAVFAARGAVHAPAAGSGDPSALLHAALRAVFTFQGFEIVPVIASQVRSPQRSVPWATVGSLVVSALLYLALQTACVLGVPDLAHVRTPLVSAAAAYGGGGLARAVAAGTTISALGISVGMMVTTPRYLSALAHGGSVALSLERLAPNGVPQRALGVTTLLVVGLVLATSRGDLFDLAGLAVLLQYVVASLALAALAQRRQHGLGTRQGWLAGPAVLASLTLVYGATAKEFALTAGAMAVGLALRRRRLSSCPPL